MEQEVEMERVYVFVWFALKFQAASLLGVGVLTFVVRIAMREWRCEVEMLCC